MLFFLLNLFEEDYFQDFDRMTLDGCENVETFSLDLLPDPTFL